MKGNNDMIEKFTDFTSGESSNIKDILFKILENKAIPGVSAPEVNIPFQVIAIKNYTDLPWIVAFNPRIVYSSDELLAMHETCYSYPGIKVRINRPRSIRVRYQDISGETTTATLEGPVARLFQHEMVHMTPGKVFWQDASFLHKNKAKNDWKALARRLGRD